MPEIRTVLPKYLQIANDVRERILRGDLVPDMALSERQMAAEWGVARPTVTKALEVLRREGLLEARQGAGTFVRDVRTHRRAAHRYHRYRQQGAQYGADESMSILRAELVPIPEQVAAAFGLDLTENAIVRQRLVTRESVGPVEISTSWWPAAYAEQAPRLLDRASLGGIGSVRYLEAVSGRAASYARDQVAARLASEEERALLQLAGEVSAVLTYRHTVFDASDRPMEFAEAVYLPDVWTFEQEYPIEG